MSADIVPIRSEVVEFDPVAAGLAELERRFASLVFDMTTTKGIEDARVARRELVALRGSLEETRETLKRPVLARGKLIDAEAKRIREAIEKLEDPIDADIRRVEKAKEEAREARLKAEAEKIAAIRRLIVQTFPAMDAAWIVSSAEALRRRYLAVELMPVDATFGDLKIEAQMAKTVTLDALAVLIGAADKADAERAELARQREENAVERARLAAEKREQDRVEAERQRVIEEARRSAMAQEEAERARHAAEAERMRVAAQEREDAALVARTRLQVAAPAMLKALQLWQHADKTRSADDLAEAEQARDEAIAAATGEHLEHRTALL